MFLLLYSLSFIDRQMLNLMVEPVKATLRISDFEVSLLQGFSFALFYTVFGLGIGWLVDHRARRPIVATGIAVWSLACTACGLATQFWHLALGRAGVAAGEAALAPAAYSIMSDTFPPRKLAMPMSLMGSGAPLGTGVAMLIGGFILTSVPATGFVMPLLGRLEAWQIAFVAVGIPGLLTVPLVYTIAEPLRHRTAGAGPAAPERAVRHVLRAQSRFYVGHFLGFGIYSTMNYGVTSWLATFLVRQHHLSVAHAGYYAGLLVLLVSIPGSICMGLLVDRWYSRGRKDAHLRMFAICAALQACSVLASVSAPSMALSILFLVPHAFVTGFTGVAAAGLQIATPRHVRGQVSALYLFVFNLLGLGLGPSLVGACTDFVFRDESRLGASLALVNTVLAPLAIGCLLFAAPAMRRLAARQDNASVSG